MNWNGTSIERRAKHGHPHSQQQHQSPDHAVQSAHTFQPEPVSPEEHPQSDVCRSQNCILKKFDGGLTDPSGVVAQQNNGAVE